MDAATRMKQKWQDPEYREMILKSRKGKMKAWNKGKTAKEFPSIGISVKKAQDALRGKPAWNKGLKMPKLTRENNPNWKGGITMVDKLERNKFRDTMQKLIFERDNYTCQMCGQNGGSLQVDHVQSWSEFVELRFSMDNCRTLCMDCHYLITYGRVKPENVIWGHNLKKVRVSP